MKRPVELNISALTRIVNNETHLMAVALIAGRPIDMVPGDLAQRISPANYLFDLELRSGNLKGVL